MATPPTAPSILTTEELDHGVRLRWSPPVADSGISPVTGYQVTAVAADGTTRIYKVTDANAKGVLLGDLPNATADPALTVLPTSTTILPDGAGPQVGSEIVGTNPLADASDATYARAVCTGTTTPTLAEDRLVVSFGTVAGVSGATADEVAVTFRVQLNDTVPGPHLARLYLYMDAPKPGYSDPGMSFVWQASLPDHTRIYDDGLPIGPTDPEWSSGSFVYPEGITTNPNYWWWFENRSSPTYSTDGTANEDPWPRITAALAAGALRIQLYRDTRYGPAATGDVTVYQLGLRVLP